MSKIAHMGRAPLAVKATAPTDGSNWCVLSHQPVPWATNAATNIVLAPGRYRLEMTEAGKRPTVYGNGFVNVGTLTADAVVEDAVKLNVFIEKGFAPATLIITPLA